MSRRNRPTSHGDAYDCARLAARLLVEGTVRGFGAAKRKAAALSGMRTELPSNLAILHCVIEYQRIFEMGVLPARNARLRRAALDALAALDRFSPRLHGAVLHGTTLATSAVELHLFCDEPEEITRFLLNRGQVYALADVQLTVAPHRKERFVCFHTSTQAVDFELTVLPVRALRQRLLSPLDGMPYRYLTHAELTALVASDPGGVHQVEFAASAYPPR